MVLDANDVTISRFYEFSVIEGFIMKFPDTILIVDDAIYNRTTLIKLIKKQLPNVEIDEAGDGKMSIDLVTHQIGKHQKNYDMIVMDFQMPGLNGQLTTKAIRQIEQEAKLNDTSKAFIVTWTSQPEYTNKPYAGANTLMNKNSIDDADITKVLQIYCSI